MGRGELRGIDAGRVGDWLARHLPGATPPFDYALVAAGGSNLTYRVTDAGGRSVALRRPPAGARIATAHDMHREWRILDALHRLAPAVPVPAPLAWCGDEGVTGAPFYAMAFVEGTILRGAADTASWAPADFARATESLVETQVALHALDVDAVGLGDLARERTGYVARQLRRWKKQAEASKTREVPLLHELHDRLLRALPPEPGPPALVHGDYRFDNTVLGDDRRVIAVFDWELATIGDPVADFCWSLLYWSDPGDRVHALTDPPTLAPGFPRRAEVAALYAKRSGRDLTHLDTYLAFSWWKQACIVEGVLARVRQGATGGMRVSSPEEIAARVDLYLALADDLSRGL